MKFEGTIDLRAARHHRLAFSLVVMTLLWLGGGFDLTPFTPSRTLAVAVAGGAPTTVSQDQKPFLRQHCIECHSGEKPKGDLGLDQLSPDFSDAKAQERWRAVMEKVSAGEMPPKKKPRPPEAEVRALTQWIGEQLQAQVAVRRAKEGRIVLRRLNRMEYENTVRDLLGIHVELQEMLPQDSASNGFDNVGEALHTSSFLMEKYLEAANAALDQAICNRLKQPPTLKQMYFMKDQHPVKSSPERVYRKTGDAVAIFTSSLWSQFQVSDFWPEQRGRYRFRISSSSVQSPDKPVTFRVWAGNGGMGGAPGHLVSYFDAPSDQPKVFEFIDYVEPHTGLSILPYGLPSAQTVDKIGADAYKGPGLEVQWVEIEGPLNEVWPPQSHRGLFGDLKQVEVKPGDWHERVEVVSTNPLADAEPILRTFARRAFRRTITDADVRPILKLVERKLAEKRSFEQSVRAGLLAILMSPDFLFLREQPSGSDAGASGPALNDFALASRLSYFLWSTMPDEELIALAVKGELPQPEALRKQVDRMLNDPRSAAFVHNFCGQWLGLRNIDATEPSVQLYPEYDDMLKESMIRETELFFNELLKDDLSLTNFLSSDFSMLNGRLARHYGIGGVEGWAFRKTPLPPSSHRGGLLTMASVLKVTANGTSTSPVMRGAWVLDRILGSPPPRPPADIAAIEPDTRGSTTIREQLAKHRKIESCANCHARIDPPGFAMESFDVIGGWREFYRSNGNGEPITIDGRQMPYYKGKPVDPADTMPDGRAFENIDEFKQLLMADKDRFATALTEKLLTYATGGPIEPAADKARVEAIVQHARDRNYGFRTLIHEIVQSELFRTK